MSFYSVGVSGLNAAQLGLSTTGHNITNVNTAGFHRQEIVQGTNPALLYGSGYIGQGTNVETVKRIYSQFLDSQVLQSQSSAEHLNTYLSQVNLVDDMLADANTGISPALQDFFKAVQDLGASPSSVPSRQALLSNTSAMITRFNVLDQNLSQIRDGVNSQITETVRNINSYAQQISNLNAQILFQRGTTNGHPMNDLLDQREQVIAELNKLVKATTIDQGDGSMSVFIGNGQPLVVGPLVYGLTAVPSPEDQRRVEVAYKYASSTTILRSDNLTGGKLGGLLEFRSDVLDPSQNALGRVAIGLAQSFNDQHKLGQDLAGNLGEDFFATPTPSVLPSTLNTGSGDISAVISSVSGLTTSDYRIVYDGSTYSVTDLSTNVSTTGLDSTALQTAIPGLTLTENAAPDAGDVFTVQPTRLGARDIALSATINTTTIAAATPIRTAISPSNKGDAKISAGTVDTVTANPDPLHPSTDADLLQPVTITFNDPPTDFDVNGSGLNLPDTGIAYVSGGNISYNGWTVQISGIPKAGDTFTIGPNTKGVADSRNVLLLGGLQTQNLMIGGTTSFQGSYSQLVSLVGNKTAEIQVTSTAQNALVEQAVNAQQSLSGVNLDEEAANLMRYQQAYQAAGKMMQIASTLLDTLLSIGN